MNMGFIEVGNYTTIQRRSKLLVVKVHTNKKIRKSSTNFHPNCIFDELLNSRISFFSIIWIKVRRALRKAEKELEYQSWKAPAVLKQWLQMTFDKETKHFQQKRTVALKQMKEAKEAVRFEFLNELLWRSVKGELCSDLLHWQSSHLSIFFPKILTFSKVGIFN